MNVGEESREVAAFAVLLKQLRSQGLSQLILHAGGGSFKSQMKKADKSGAHYAAIFGEDEAATEEISLKPLLKAGEQTRCQLNEVFKQIKG